MMEDYYKILEVLPDALPEEIKHQYNFLVQAWHPDKFRNPEQKAKAEQRTKALNEAYSVLRDPNKRTDYDRERAANEGKNSEKAERQRQSEENMRRAEHERQRQEQAETGRQRSEKERQQRESAAEQLRAEEKLRQQAKVQQEQKQTKQVWLGIIALMAVLLGVVITRSFFREPTLPPVIQTPVIQTPVIQTLVIQTLGICVQPPAGLVSWWPGDGNTNDIVDGNSAALQGGTTFVVGKVDQAFQLDGIDDYVYIGNPANLKLVDSITLAAWVNPQTDPPSDDRSLSGMYAILTKWGQSVDVADSYGLWLHNPDGITQPLSSIILTGSGGIGIKNGGVIPSGAWSHIAMTYDRTSGVQRIYVNGVFVGEYQGSGGIRTSDTTVLMGKEDSSLPRFFNGAIDEVQIFNRALSGAEILAIYNAGSAGVCKDETPTATNTPILTP